MFVRLRWHIAPFEWVLPHIKSTDRILEIGCGHGLLANFIKFHHPDAAIVATDSNASKIALACRTIQERNGLEFLAVPGFPRTEGSFDAILFFDLLHHCPQEEHQALLLQAKDRLRPGGRIIVKEMFKEFSLPHFLNWLHDKIVTLGEKTHYRKAQEWIALANQAGLKRVHFQKGYKFWYHQCLFVFEV